jgi:hypothetical protein
VADRSKEADAIVFVAHGVRFVVVAQVNLGVGVEHGERFFADLTTCPAQWWLHDRRYPFPVLPGAYFIANIDDMSSSRDDDELVDCSSDLCWKSEEARLFVVGRLNQSRVSFLLESG